MNFSILTSWGRGCEKIEEKRRERRKDIREVKDANKTRNQ